MVASANNRTYKYNVMFPNRCLNYTLYGKKTFVFRSSWEKRVMSFLELNSLVVEWGYELPDMVVKYKLPEPDTGVIKEHRYIPDVYVKMKKPDGTTVQMIWEIKPKKETVAPVKPKRMTEKSKKNYIMAQLTWAKNQAKWAVAVDHFSRIGMKFSVVTEDSIFNNKK